MSEGGEEGGGTLNFDRVDATVTPAGVTCGTCAKNIPDAYFQVDGQVACATCKDARAAADARPHTKEALMAALLFGGGAAILGSIVWFTVAKITGLEIGLVAIGVGIFVGRAVHRGAGRGGRRYQVLAVALTYLSIVASYVPDVAEGLIKGPSAEQGKAEQGKAEQGKAEQDKAEQGKAEQGKAGGKAEAGTAKNTAAPKNDLHPFVALLLLGGVILAIAIAAPFLAGVSNILGLAIIAFALWEAWRVNRHKAAVIAGPYQVAAAGEPIAASA